MTDAELISSLAADLRPVPPGGGVARDFAFTAACGAAASVAIAALGLGVQPGLPGPAGAAFLMKTAYTLSLGGLALAVALRLARPDGRALPRMAFAAPLAVMGLIAAVATPWSSAHAAFAAMMGSSWPRCLPLILLVGSPIFAAAIVALRRQAPVRLREAGAAAGLMAGAGGAAAYALACGESAPAFVFVWYTTAIVIGGALGALAGPRLLRW